MVTVIVDLADRGACDFDAATTTAPLTDNTRTNVSATTPSTNNTLTNASTTTNAPLVKCPNDKENDIDSDGFCHAEDACPYETVNDADGDKLCDISLCSNTSQVDCSKLTGDPCPLDRRNDIDSDNLCGDIDPCPFETKNDEDKDGKCAFTVCGQDSPTFMNFAGDGCRSYEPGQINHEYCTKDKDACVGCPCACAAQCGDPCPKDAKDDSDGDKVCDSQDSCPKDKLNDRDGDKVCDFFPETIQCNPANFGLKNNPAYHLSSTDLFEIGETITVSCNVKDGFTSSVANGIKSIQIKCTGLGAFRPDALETLECCLDHDKDGVCGSRENCDVSDLELPTGYNIVTSKSSIFQGDELTVECAAGYFAFRGYENAVKCENPDSFKSFSIERGFTTRTGLVTFYKLVTA